MRRVFTFVLACSYHGYRVQSARKLTHGSIAKDQHIFWRADLDDHNSRSLLLQSGRRVGILRSSKSLAILLLAFNNLSVGWRLTGNTRRPTRAKGTFLSQSRFPFPGTPLALVGGHVHRAHAPVFQQTISPFKPESTAAAGPANSEAADGPLALTRENVELVLDEMRPYLVADGGNVTVVEIDDGVVRLQLQGACESCPSSTVTMSNGLERGLLAKIPDITSVQQVVPGGMEVTEADVEAVLDEIRKFLQPFKSTVDLVELSSAGVQRTVRLSLAGPGSKVAAVRQEIAKRLRSKFPIANVICDVS